MNLKSYKEQYAGKFNQKHLLSLKDYSKQDILTIIELAQQLKHETKTTGNLPVLKDKVIGLIFTKSSTRTRVSFEVSVKHLGGDSLFLSSNDIQIGRGESIHDTAKVLSRYIDAIMIRTYNHSDLEELVEYGTLPIINGLTDYVHPCQILADLLTYYEHKGTLKGKMAYIGDGNNIANSLLLGCSKVGMDIAIGCPKNYQPDRGIINHALEAARETGSKVVITSDLDEALKDADCVYTDVWASMGQEAEAKQRQLDFSGYQVNDSMMAKAKKDAIFMHCLPAHRGEEVSASVIDGKQSVVFDEAENRIHAQKAVMALIY